MRVVPDLGREEEGIPAVLFDPWCDAGPDSGLSPVKRGAVEMTVARLQCRPVSDPGSRVGSFIFWCLKVP